jgi:hypothetical protein
MRRQRSARTIPGSGRLARQYEDLKRQLAARHAGDREAYTAAKAAFVANALAGPGASAGHRRTEPLK